MLRRPHPRPLSRLRRRRASGEHLCRQCRQLLGRHAAGIVQIAGKDHVIEPAQQPLEHPAKVLFLRRAKDQQSPPGRKTLVQNFDQCLDRRRVVGRVDHHGRPPGDDFHPRRPNHLGQSAANGGLGNRPAGLLQFFHRRQHERRVGGLMPTQEPEGNIFEIAGG